MKRSRSGWVALVAFPVPVGRGFRACRSRESNPPRRIPPPAWLGEELPLPLSVKTPQDLALKAVAERQYLVFNLLARGKMAWDAGDFATAAASGRRCCACPASTPSWTG